VLKDTEGAPFLGLDDGGVTAHEECYDKINCQGMKVRKEEDTFSPRQLLPILFSSCVIDRMLVLIGRRAFICG